MEEKISIFDIEMDNLTAKETMIQAMQFLESESIDTIEIMSMDMLLSGQEDMEWKEQVGRIGIVLPGDKEILTAADVRDRKRLREAEERVFLRMFMKYLQKNHGRVYLLAETEEELERVEDSVRRYNRGIRIVGHALLSAQSGPGGDRDQRYQRDGDRLYFVRAAVPVSGTVHIRKQGAAQCQGMVRMRPGAGQEL